MSRNKRHYLVIVCCTFVQIGVSCVLLNSLSTIADWSAVHAEDSRGYMLVALYCGGQDVPHSDIPLLRYRLFNPVVPLLVSTLSGLLGPDSAFLFLNIVLWNMTALAFYELLNLLLRDQTAALSGALLWTTSMPVIEWGLPVMVDAGAYFFAAIIPLAYLRLRRLRLASAALLGLLAGLAVLTKPTLLSLLLFLVACFVVDSRPMAGLAALLVASCCCLGVYRLLGLSPDDFFTFSAPRHRGILYIVSAALFCFHWGWYFFVAGWSSSAPMRKYLVIFLAAWAGPFAVFVHNPRLFFLAYPAVLPVVVLGLRARFPDKKRTAFVVCAYILTSNFLAATHLYVMRTLQIRDMESLLRWFGTCIAGT